MEKLTSTYTMHNGVKIPCLGYGTWQMPVEDAEKGVAQALRAGYRHIDTAAKYGNEAGVGRAIKNSGIKRENIFLTSKLWNADQGYESTLKAFADSLEKLKTDYLDLYLIHWPIVKGHENDWQETLLATWRAMEKLYLDKKIRAIGVCNCLVRHLKVIMDNTKIMPIVDQIEIHPCLNHQETVNFAKKYKMIVEGWSPLGHAAILKDETLCKIAAKHQKSAAQIALRWAMQNDIIPLPKSVTPSRIRENTQIFDFTITSEDMQLINNLPQMTDTLGADPDKSIH